MLIERHEELTSTFDRARELLAEDVPSGFTVLAERQTQGRGRLGRSFFSPPGENIYLTMILRPQFPPEKLPLLTVFAGLVVCESISAVCSLTPRCKWPNDILLSTRKVCGILAENIWQTGSMPIVLLGVGLNVNQREFPPELRELATSLALETGASVNREVLLDDMLPRLRGLASDTPETAEWLQAYRALCVTPGQRVRVTQGGAVRMGLALRVDDNAALVVRFDDGTEQSVTSGEVSLSGYLKS